MQLVFEIQLLRSSDMSLMRELNLMFARAFSEPDTYVDGSPGDDYLDTWLSNENHIALVATVADTVAGGLVAYILDKFEQARREIYIYDLAVAEEYRRSGIATALIRRVQEIAKETGAWVIFVQADYGDDPAIALYQKIGEREDVVHFDIPVT